MDIGSAAAAIEAAARPSPLPGFEYVRGYGVYSMPFDSGHVLALRVFPENDFAPYRTIWHRSPEGVWSIYADSPRLDIACPRYYSAATELCTFASISLSWTSPATLAIQMDSPQLSWTVSMGDPPLFRLANRISHRIPEPQWRSPTMLRTFERVAGSVFGLGDVTLSGSAPNGHFAVVMPVRMFPVVSATARFDGTDLGAPARVSENPSIGPLRLPARPIFAIGRAYFEMQDGEEYRRTIAQLRSGRA